MNLTLSKIAAFVSATSRAPSEDVVRGYSIDSRTVGPGQLFFAVKGERLDGHDFVEQALEKGAVAAGGGGKKVGGSPQKAGVTGRDGTLGLLARVGRLCGE